MYILFYIGLYVCLGFLILRENLIKIIGFGWCWCMCLLVGINIYICFYDGARGIVKVVI